MKIKELGVLSSSEFYSHIPSEFGKNYLFTVHFAGRYDCDKNYLIERDFFEYYLILRIIHGEFCLEFNNQSYTAYANDLILFDCRIPHKYYAKGNVKFEYIHFKGNVSKALYDEIMNCYSPIISIQNNIEIVESLDTIISMFDKNRVNDFKSSYEIHKILGILLEDHLYSSSCDEALKKVIRYISINYSKHLTIKDLADIANLSVYHFSRRFKLLTSSSPHEYLILQRLFNAKTLLKNTVFSINKISELVGFNTPSHFIATFKKHTDMTPNEFRRLRF